MMPERAPQGPVSELISVGVQEVVRTARRLGLVWDLRVGVVTEVTSASLSKVRLDGDSESVSAVTMVGTTFENERVYVISVPPAGNFVAGAVDRIYPRSRIATAVRDTNSAAFTAETVTDTVTASLIEGLTYTVNSFTLTRSSVAGDRNLIRIREDSLTGNQLRAAAIVMPAAGAGTDFPLYQEVLYTATATGDKTFVLTGGRAAGSGSITHTAGTTNPVYLYVELVQ